MRMFFPLVFIPSLPPEKTRHPPPITMSKVVTSAIPIMSLVITLLRSISVVVALSSQLCFRHVFSPYTVTHISPEVILSGFLADQSEVSMRKYDLSSSWCMLYVGESSAKTVTHKQYNKEKKRERINKTINDLLDSTTLFMKSQIFLYFVIRKKENIFSQIRKKIFCR